ncbi:MAG: hypothetical protein GYA23_10130 [Methanomicrobiales archaeon]|nr:hypothetical protein [Methanomicrobiales archaeon]
MYSNEQSGLLEQIQPAIQPLTETGDFYLKSISINDFESAIIIQLSSPGLEMRYGATAIHSHVNCVFIIHSLKKFFSIDYLSPALKLNITINKGEFLENYPSPPSGIIETTEKYQARWDAILKGVNFIEELNRQCIGIRDNLPEIRRAFSPENIDETVRVYSAEYKKTNPLATGPFCNLDE